jgi:hypothetical protein
MDPATDWVVNGGKGALDFDGSNDHINLGNVLSFERTDPFSISAWVRVLSFSSFGTITTKMASANLRGYFFNYNTNGTLAVIIRSLSSGNRIFVQTSSAALSLGVWGHVVLTYDGSSQASGVKFYADGTTLATTTTENTLTGTIVTTQPLTFGGRPALSDGFANAQMDDFRFYRRVLTPGYVRQLWQLGRGNMPMVRKRRYTEQAAAGFKAYWARRQSQLIGGGV